MQVRTGFSGNNGAANSTAVSATLPAGIQDGDYGLAILAVSTGTSDPTTPTGWTLVDGPVSNIGSTIRGWLYSRKMVVADSGGTITSTLSTSRQWSISGIVIAGGPIQAIDAETSTNTNTDSTTVAFSSLNVVRHSCLLIAMAGLRYSTTTTGMTPTAAFTERCDDANTTAAAPRFGTFIETYQLSGLGGTAVSIGSGTSASSSRGITFSVTVAPISDFVGAIPI